jgi:hypothetical protein
VILHCASSGRASLAGKLRKDLSYQKVYNLGGFARLHRIRSCWIVQITHAKPA